MNKANSEFRTETEGPMISLIGNPNVGKSSIFNALTGMHQHTGNWPGKTVNVAHGRYLYHDRTYTIVDLPGTYTLSACSEEEEISREFLLSGQSDCIVVVGDATCLERNLILLYQIMAIGTPVIFCINLLDEAKKQNIRIDLSALEQELKVPVIGTVATTGAGLERLKEIIEGQLQETSDFIPQPPISYDVLFAEDKIAEETAQALAELAAEQFKRVVQKERNVFGHRFDQIALHPWAGRLLMLFLLFGVFWLTIIGANYPSAVLQRMFTWIKSYLTAWTVQWPEWLSGILIEGIYETVTKVIAVMLPPMAIFFPLFTFLEDVGYLPRIAFLMDHCFERCGSCGKQSLTMAMGFGCNAAGVVGCRIISSPKERMIAILTNAFVPCNGRFPVLIALATIFFSENSLVGAAILTLLVLVSIAVTLFASGLLNKTILKGEESHFILEMPPYRRPRVVPIIVHSLCDRTIFVLSRAVLVAAPCGALIWLLQFVRPDGVSLLTRMAQLLHPIGVFFGMNGVVVAAFLLSFPANELLLPLIVMITQGQLGSFEIPITTVENVLLESGWDWKLALLTMLFLLFHWPCGTTCLTIHRETKSWKWTALAFFLPTVIGLFLCRMISML